MSPKAPFASKLCSYFAKFSAGCQNIQKIKLLHSFITTERLLLIVNPNSKGTVYSIYKDIL